MPLFSIVIPCFNAAETLAATLDGLTAQTCGDWEAVCVDDGSTDATLALLAAAAARDPRIRVARNPGKGPSGARNHGASLARAGIVAFCDADDIWVETKLADLAVAFADEKVDGAFSRVAFFTDAPGDSPVTSNPPSGPLSIDTLLGENPTCTMSNVSVRRAVFERSGGFALDMVHNEDLDWLIRICGEGVNVVGLPVVHVHYRTSPSGLSSDLDAMARGRERALASARGFGILPDARAEAAHQRYLARRALRLGEPAAWRMTLRGLACSPTGFLFPLRRGGAVAAASLAAPFLPRAMSRALFAR